MWVLGTKLGSSVQKIKSNRLQDVRFAIDCNIMFSLSPSLYEHIGSMAFNQGELDAMEHHTKVGIKYLLIGWEVVVYTFHPSTQRQRQMDLCEFLANMVDKSQYQDS